MNSVVEGYVCGLKDMGMNQGRRQNVQAEAGVKEVWWAQGSLLVSVVLSLRLLPSGRLPECAKRDLRHVLLPFHSTVRHHVTLPTTPPDCTTNSSSIFLHILLQPRASSLLRQPDMSRLV